MSRSSFLGDMLQSMTERGRQFLPFNLRDQSAGRKDMEAMCNTLLSSTGEASGMAIAKNIMDRWAAMDDEAALRFMVMLLEKFGPDTDALDKAIDAYREAPTQQALLALHKASEPRRQELIRRLNLAPNGIATLVSMRRTLLKLRETRPELQTVDADFAHLFGSWFNRGFLVLKPIDWSTPADILEKIIRYEAVHEIGSWEELRRRLAPEDRRCFAFFHPQLADEPLIFVEVALTREIPATIAEVLDEQREHLSADQTRTAVFYSISNCQEGLRGISFGNFLIKQVVEDLRRDFPRLDTFVTLSPAPGFAKWLAAERAAGDDGLLDGRQREALEVLDKPGWADSGDERERLRQPMLEAAAWYFLRAKRPDGGPVDPVARFHLGNGARLERLNFLADRAPRAMGQAHGLMVNYLYKLEEIETNHEAFASRGEVAAAPQVRRLVRGGRAQRGGTQQQAAAAGPEKRSAHAPSEEFIQ